MIDFAYYTNVFSGKLLEKDDFEKIMPRALDYVKFYTGCRFKECDEVKKAVCAVCEVYFKFGERDGVKSESNDGISRTFQSGDVSQCADRAIAIYLANTGILYRGM